MAAPLRSQGLTRLSNFVLQDNLCSIRGTARFCTSHLQSDKSRSCDNDRKPQIAVSKDGSTFLCWHPEPAFPYEHTKPLPRRQEEMELGDSVLKVQHIRSHTLRSRENGPNMRELQQMFFTTKHRWFPKPQKRYQKRDPPKDRDSL